MKEYTARQVQRQFSLICDDVDVDGGVIVVKGNRRYLLSPLPVDGDDKPSVDVGRASVAKPVDSGDTAPLGGGEVVELLREQTALLRELVEQGRGISGGVTEKPQAAQVAAPGKLTVTARVDEEPQEEPEPAEPRELPKVVIPERLEDPKPKPPGEPSRGELRAAYEYFGLRETPDGLEVTERGIRSALGTVKKVAQEDPDSPEAQILKMGAADEDRIECLRLVQLDKLSKALAKRADGDPKWLGMATPPRF
ncbi:hypothetical protein OH738_10665 [Streptomyces hirsutus]|uniref:Uncharacterized protein n=1 Tax=Streptomyces hirsutus TaxID=35620 RepID=A0ABZ1GWA0_9ACTN|nr:hypothetical protein [Streptomyces hirsutus]WSD09349.1 hypothetical protein OIE73_28810 [Streptomyces hirsutus]WTD17201.1 hypothetical protein OH738_10665 [Streptomyces hirsutus]